MPRTDILIQIRMADMDYTMTDHVHSKIMASHSVCQCYCFRMANQEQTAVIILCVDNLVMTNYFGVLAVELCKPYRRLDIVVVVKRCMVVVMLTICQTVTMDLVCCIEIPERLVKKDWDFGWVIEL